MMGTIRRTGFAGFLAWYAAVTAAAAGPPKDFPQSRDEVRTAMEFVESSNNPYAVNIKEDAVGVLQIRPIMVDEVNRLQRLRGPNYPQYTLQDRYDVTLSREMFGIYTDYWCSRRDMWTQEYMAKIWNGGSNGHTKAATAGYWHKVKVRMGRVSD